MSNSEQSIEGGAFGFIESSNFLVKGAIATAHERLQVFDEFYRCQWTCQTVFQKALTPVAQNYVARLLCVNDAIIDPALVEQWIMPGEHKLIKHDLALKQLYRLCILFPMEVEHEDTVIPVRLQDTAHGIKMNAAFQQNLRKQLFCFESPLEKISGNSSKNLWTFEEYMQTEHLSRARWKRVLWYILRCSSRKQRYLRVSSEEVIDTVISVRGIIPLLEQIKLIGGSSETNSFFENMKAEERTTSRRKRAIDGDDSDSDNETQQQGNNTDAAMRKTLLITPRDLELHTVLPKGFAFLLMDTEQQMWFFVEQYIKLLKNQRHRIEVFQFIVRLSYCIPGKKYVIKGNLTAPQVRALHQFSSVGITAVKSVSAKYFQVGVYGSNLLFGQQMEVGAIPFGQREIAEAKRQAAMEASGAIRKEVINGGADADGIDDNLSSHQNQGHSKFRSERDELISSRLQLLVETNFYVTAFISKDPEIAEIEKDVLRLFMTIEVALPQAIICQIKPHETREAIRRGITAAQMQQFLERHAHKRMRQKALSALEREFGDEAYGLDDDNQEELESHFHAVPHNVVEQLHMWESEENRLNDRPAALFKNCFSNEIEFNRCLDYCEEHQCLLWASKEKYIIVVDENHSAKVTQLIRSASSTN